MRRPSDNARTYEAYLLCMLSAVIQIPTQEETNEPVVCMKLDVSVKISLTLERALAARAVELSGKISETSQHKSKFTYKVS